MYSAEFQWLNEADLQNQPCKIRCPHCFQKLDLSLLQPFSQTECPACRQRVTVPVIFAGFELYELLSETPRCRIYQAKDNILQREIALKITRNSDFNEYYRESFARLAALEHPGVLWVYTSGDFGAYTYAALQWMENGTVTQSNLRDSLGVEKLLGSFIPLIDALEMTERRKVVHHDICPANLFCSAEGHLRLANFRPGEGEWPLPKDNWQYRSPEALSAQHFDAAGDLYSLAVTAYELFSGQYPFGQFRDVNTLIDRQNKRTFAPLHECNPLISPALSESISQTLSPEPAERPHPAKLKQIFRRELAALLEHYR